MHVLVVTPFGKHGRGGVDRMTDIIRRDARENPDTRFRLHFVASRGPGSIWLSPFYLVRAAFVLLGLRAIGRLDLVHINIVQRGSTLRKLILVYLARLVRTPYVLHLHGSLYRQYWESVPPWLSARIRSAFEHAANVIVLGAVWRALLATKAPRARTTIVQNATYAPKVGREHADSSEPVHILFLGQIGGRKGTPDLIQALARLKTTKPWRVTLAGNGQVQAARQQIASLGLAERVDVPGWVGPEEVERLLGDADILVLPSHDETLPLSVIEGMGYGLAVVTTPVGSVPDIIEDGRTGLLHPPGDVVALSEALERVIGSSAFRAQLGSAAREFHSSHLSVDTYIRRLKALWFASVPSHREPPAAQDYPTP